LTVALPRNQYNQLEFPQQAMVTDSVEIQNPDCVTIFVVMNFVYLICLKQYFLGVFLFFVFVFVFVFFYCIPSSGFDPTPLVHCCSDNSLARNFGKIQDKEKTLHI
jgi:hypothetical protein